MTLQELKNIIDNFEVNYRGNYSSAAGLAALYKTFQSHNITIEDWNLTLQHLSKLLDSYQGKDSAKGSYDATKAIYDYLASNPIHQISVNSTGTSIDEVRYITIDGTEKKIAGDGTFNYNELENKPQINDVELSGDKSLDDLDIQSKITATNKLDYDLLDNTPTIPTVNDAAITLQKNGTAIDSFTVNQSTNKSINITVPTQPSDIGAEAADATILKQANVVNSTSSTSTTAPLAANVGKVLNDKIEAIEGRGRYLTTWDASEGKPSDLPGGGSSVTEVYVYKSGDYFIVKTAGDKVPTGTQIEIGTTIATFPSTTGASSKVNDTIYFNGTTWTVLAVPTQTVTYSSIVGDPYDQPNTAIALNAKANDASVVHLAGTETISGTKTFTSNIRLSNDSNVYLGGYDSADPNLYLENLQGSTYISASTSVGAQISNKPTVSYNGDALQASSNDAVDLGSSAYKFKNLYLSNTLSDGTNSTSIANIVTKDGAQTITGTKTFKHTPLVFTNSSDTEVGRIEYNVSDTEMDVESTNNLLFTTLNGTIRFRVGNASRFYVEQSSIFPASSGEALLGKQAYPFNTTYTQYLHDGANTYLKLERIVDTNNAQTITGTKTFKGTPIIFQDSNGTEQGRIEYYPSNNGIDFTSVNGNVVIASYAGVTELHGVTGSTDTAINIGYNAMYPGSNDTVSLGTESFNYTNVYLNALAHGSNYLAFENIEDNSNKVTSWSATTTDAHYPSEKLVKDECDNIRAVAAGKCKTYIIQSQSDITGTKGSSDQYTNVTAITGVTLSDLKLGDEILIKDLNVPDYWVSQITPTYSLNKLETSKVDLDDYVTKNTIQTITGRKTFNNSVCITNGSITNRIYTGTNGNLLFQYDYSGSSEHNMLSLDDTEIALYATTKPSQSGNFDLGTSSNLWKDLYLQGNLIDSNSNSVSIANIETLNTAQTITARKTFTTGPIVKGDSLYFQNTSGTETGRIEYNQSDDAFDIISTCSGNFTLSSNSIFNFVCVGNTQIYMGYNAIYPAPNHTGNLGLASYRWDTIYVNNINNGTNGITTTALLEAVNSFNGWYEEPTENELDYAFINNLGGKDVDDSFTFRAYSGGTISQVHPTYEINCYTSAQVNFTFPNTNTYILKSNDVNVSLSTNVLTLPISADGFEISIRQVNSKYVILVLNLGA